MYNFDLLGSDIKTSVYGNHKNDPSMENTEPALNKGLDHYINNSLFIFSFCLSGRMSRTHGISTALKLCLLSHFAPQSSILSARIYNTMLKPMFGSLPAVGLICSSHCLAWSSLGTRIRPLWSDTVGCLWLLAMGDCSVLTFLKHHTDGENIKTLIKLAWIYTWSGNPIAMQKPALWHWTVIDMWLYRERLECDS